MCSRFSQKVLSHYTDLLKAIANHSSVDTKKESDEYHQVRPTDIAWVCAIGRDGRRHLAPLRWGLVPAWSKNSDTRINLFNARAETVHEKPTFRDAFRYRRCLIPAEDFFEWSGNEKPKQLYIVRRRDRVPLVFAGLWEHWRNKDGRVINSFTIIVTEANSAIAPIHDRMPVILEENVFDRWLNSAINPMDLRDLLNPWKADLQVEKICGRMP